MQERIQNACIKWRYINSTEVKYAVGWNHAQCMDWFSTADIPAKDRDLDFEKYGFLTTSDRFVDRKEAYKIAKTAGQLRFERDDETLYSEFVKYL